MGWLFLVALLVLSPARPCYADQAEAQALFNSAEEAFAQADYARAAALFEQANRHAPHPSVLFNAALSWDQAGNFSRAANDYLSALEDGGLSPEQTEESERRLAALAQRLGYVQIAKPLGTLVSVAHLERQPVPARFYLEPGSYTLALEGADGTKSSTSITVAAGETLKVSLDLVLAPPPPPPETKPSAPPPPPPPPPAETSVQRTAGWVSIGVGVVASGLAIYLGTQALSAKDKFETSRTAASREDAARLGVATNVAWSGAGLAGGLGLVLLLTTPQVEF